MEDSSLLIMNGYHKPHHRVLKPPGGDTHDIFGTGNASAYNEATEASRRARSANHHAQLSSNIFDPIPYTNGKFKENGNVNGNGVVHRASESEKNSDEEEIVSENGSYVALDEIDGKQETKKLVKDHMRSNVFANWNDAATNGNNAPRRQSNGGGGGNPITGEGYSSGCCNSNGESKGGSRGKYPPGGPSSNLW